MWMRCCWTRPAPSRWATARQGFFAAPGVAETERQAALLASLADETPEGRSILAYARERHGLDGHPAGGRHGGALHRPDPAFGPGHPGPGQLPQGRGGQPLPRIGHRAAGRAEGTASVERIARAGATPLAVSRDGRMLGVIELKDIVKPGMRARFDALPHGHPHRDGHRRQPLHRSRHRRRGRVDDFIAEATPEDKLAYIRNAQKEGRLVAMAGDGTNDALALARRPMWAWPCRPAPRPRVRPGTWWIWTATPPS